LTAQSQTESKKSMNFGNNLTNFITEASEVEEEYKNEVSSLGKDVSNE
jgi:hypothetical protein